MYNYDFDELVEEYGYEYLSEYYPDDCAYPMDELDELTNYTAEQAITRAFYGYDWCPGADSDHNLREQFNPNKEYFAFNGYGNLVSIDSHYYLDWLKRGLDEERFVEWCAERGYIEDEDEEDIEGVGLISHLTPIYDSRKSFGGKAIVDESNDGSVLVLHSYNTPVATFDRTTGELWVHDYFSATTARHIREFAAQLGISLPAGKNIKGRYHA